MKRKFLEDMGLTKEQVDGILDENSQDIGKAKSDFELLQQKFNTSETENTALKEQLAERDNQLEALKTSGGDTESLKKQIEVLQADNLAKEEAHATEIKQIKLDAAVDAALIAAKSKNTKATKALLELELEKIEFDEQGSVKGLDEQIKKLASSDETRFLFDTQEKRTQIKGAVPGESGVEGADARVDISGMSYSQLAAYMEANPGAKI